MSGAGEQAARKPGRKAETPAERLARLERDLALAKEAVKEAEQRLDLTVGRAVREEAAGDPVFMARLRDILGRRVVSKTGRAAIASLLGESSTDIATVASATESLPPAPVG